MNTQEHLLTCLIEECSEVIKEATKSLRFGLDDKYSKPSNDILPALNPTNREKLIQELNDIVGTACMMVEYDMIPVDWLDKVKVKAKGEKIKKYFAYAAKTGNLTV